MNEWDERSIKEIVSKRGFILLSQYLKNGNTRRIYIEDKSGYRYDIRLQHFIERPNAKWNITDPRRPEISLYNISRWLEINNKNIALSENNNYLGNSNEMEFYCLEPDCGLKFYTRWVTLYVGKGGCSYCSGRKLSNKNRLSVLYPEIAKEWDYQSNDDTPEDVSFGLGENRWWICQNGHGKYSASIKNRTKNKSGCPKCSFSKGEKEILGFLVKWKIETIIQKRFSNCANILELPFDFYLPDYNLCIEYHGKQHYESVDFFGGEKQLKIQKKHDKIKEKYCKDNNIHLLIIPYWEFDNIEKILEETLFQ